MSLNPKEFLRFIDLRQKLCFEPLTLMESCEFKRLRKKIKSHNQNTLPHPTMTNNKTENQQEEIHDILRSLRDGQISLGDSHSMISGIIKNQSKAKDDKIEELQSEVEALKKEIVRLSTPTEEGREGVNEAILFYKYMNPDEKHGEGLIEAYNAFKNFSAGQKPVICDKCGMKVKWSIHLKD